MQNTQPASPGRIVLYAFEGAEETLHERPAIVVRVWSPKDPGGCVQLHVFVDGSNDAGLLYKGESGVSVYRTSVAPADDQDVPQANRWRWPPRV